MKKNFKLLAFALVIGAGTIVDTFAPSNDDVFENTRSRYCVPHNNGDKIVLVWSEAGRPTGQMSDPAPSVAATLIKASTTTDAVEIFSSPTGSYRLISIERRAYVDRMLTMLVPTSSQRESITKRLRKDISLCNNPKEETRHYE